MTLPTEKLVRQKPQNAMAIVRMHRQNDTDGENGSMKLKALVAAGLMLALCGAARAEDSTQGITDTTIKIGSLGPFRVKARSSLR